MKNIKKIVTTLSLAGIIMMGVTATNAGIIMSGRTETKPCTPETKVDHGIIMSGYTGIIMSGFTGIIMSGFTGILYSDLSGSEGCVRVDSGILYTD